MTEYLQINWVDGMKINKDHFIHNDNLMLFSLNKRLYSILNDHNYGVTSFWDNSRHSIDLKIEEESLKLKSCMAITRGGYLIDIMESDNVILNLQLNEIKDNYLVCISIDEILKTPTGEPNSNEMPLRHPYVKPRYILSLIKEVDFKGEIRINTLIIGRLFVNNSILNIDTNFVPPCHKILEEKNNLSRYNSCVDQLSEIYKLCIEICHKAKSKKKRGEINDLADNSFFMFEKLVYYIGSSLFESRNIFQTPIELFNIVNTLSRIILTTLRLYKSEDKEALMRYFESHLGIKPHQFEVELQEYCQFKYSHSRLNLFYDKTDYVLNALKSFCTRATQLEFHSIERVDVVTENVIVNKNKLDIF